MKIKMLKSENGSENGTVTKLFQAGKVYDVAKSLGDVFVDEMHIATCLDILTKKDFETPEDLAVIETPETTLQNKPSKWIGLQIRPKIGGDIVTVQKVNKGFKVLLSDGQRIHFNVIRNDWEMVNVH